MMVKKTHRNNRAAQSRRKMVEEDGDEAYFNEDDDDDEDEAAGPMPIVGTAAVGPHRSNGSAGAPGGGEWVSAIEIFVTLVY